jgi:hypothetical protein
MASAKIYVTVKIEFAWWFKYLYWPMTRFGIWLGLPLSTEVIISDLGKAVRVKKVS